jgi:hypothetical protein
VPPLRHDAGSRVACESRIEKAKAGQEALEVARRRPEINGGGNNSTTRSAA